MNSGVSLSMVSVAISVVRPDGLAVGRDRDRGMQRVRLAVEIEQLPACRRHAVGLRQDLIAEGEHLIGANHISFAGEVAHRFGLGPRQHLGNVVRS